MQSTLHAALDGTARLHPDSVAVDDPERGCLTYSELNRLSDRLRDRLCHLGVHPGDRVGIHLRKSIDAVASIFGILKAGAAYVPVDSEAPAARCAYILNDCSVRVLIAEQSRVEGLRGELSSFGTPPSLLLTDGSGMDLGRVLQEEDAKDEARRVATVHPDLDTLSYVLYTSGSTGKPKGVMLTHRSATSFVDWCSRLLGPEPGDRFSSHAPLHFDLSILDLFVPIKHGASLVLINDGTGKDPLRLAPLIAERRITIWYSTPSILSLLAQYGKLARHDFGALRFVLFAGEPFPVPKLRLLKAQWPAPRYLNLYGPTETNVCTYYEIPTEIPEDRTEPFPIGRSCEHFRCQVVDADERPVPVGHEGELVVSGSGVMAGYWNLPEQNARAFLVSPTGERWYRTGDLVQEESDGAFLFRGRRDRMVKRRGYRVELGEIEAGLAVHPATREVAVVAVPDGVGGVRIKAFMSVGAAKRPSIIDLKQFCAERLPRYMTPDSFTFVDMLPRTSTDKIDYQALKAQG
jgi:amino acid adenylation domain-containing protein